MNCEDFARQRQQISAYIEGFLQRERTGPEQLERIAHLDLTLVCEVPRIGPHRDAMRANIAALARIAIERVAVKATTSEKLGFTGRGEGIAAYATATLRLPWSAL